MKFPNAFEGVRKICTGEIISLIAALTTIALVLLLVAAIVEIVVYFLYLKLLGSAKNMLAA